jgi:hypothetical protein
VSWQRVAGFLAVSVFVAAVVAGLVISGSPGRQRALRLDEQRVADLRSLSNALSRYYRETRKLPGQLEALVDGRALAYMPRDPLADVLYEYEVLEPYAFDLCAAFELESVNAQAGDFWDHGQGRQCFRFDYSTMRFD